MAGWSPGCLPDGRARGIGRMPMLVYSEVTMRTTIEVDEGLLAEAQRLREQKEGTAIIHEGLKALIERETARRLAEDAGGEPGPSAERAPTDDEQPTSREPRPVREVLAEIRAAQK